MTLAELWTLKQQTDREAEAMDPCENCGVKGCVCDYCDDCGKNVNPYEHFLDWDENGEHFSDIGLIGFMKR